MDINSTERQSARCEHRIRQLTKEMHDAEHQLHQTLESFMDSDSEQVRAERRRKANRLTEMLDIVEDELQQTRRRQGALEEDMEDMWLELAELLAVLPDTVPHCEENLEGVQDRGSALTPLRTQPPLLFTVPVAACTSGLIKDGDGLKESSGSNKCGDDFKESCVYQSAGGRDHDLGEIAAQDRKTSSNKNGSRTHPNIQPHEGGREYIGSNAEKRKKVFRKASHSASETHSKSGEHSSGYCENDPNKHADARKNNEGRYSENIRITDNHTGSNEKELHSNVEWTNPSGNQDDSGNSSLGRSRKESSDTDWSYSGTTVEDQQAILDSITHSQHAAQKENGSEGGLCGLTALADGGDKMCERINRGMKEQIAKVAAHQGKVIGPTEADDGPRTDVGGPTEADVGPMTFCARSNQHSLGGQIPQRRRDESVWFPGNAHMHGNHSDYGFSAELHKPEQQVSQFQSVHEAIVHNSPGQAGELPVDRHLVNVGHTPAFYRGRARHTLTRSMRSATQGDAEPTADWYSSQLSCVTGWPASNAGMLRAVPTPSTVDGTGGESEGTPQKEMRVEAETGLETGDKETPLYTHLDNTPHAGRPLLKRQASRESSSSLGSPLPNKRQALDFDTIIDLFIQEAGGSIIMNSCVTDDASSPFQHTIVRKTNSSAGSSEALGTLVSTTSSSPGQNGETEFKVPISPGVFPLKKRKWKFDSKAGSQLASSVADKLGGISAAVSQMEPIENVEQKSQLNTNVDAVTQTKNERTSKQNVGSFENDQRRDCHAGSGNGDTSSQRDELIKTFNPLARAATDVVNSAGGCMHKMVIEPNPHHLLAQPFERLPSEQSCTQTNQGRNHRATRTLENLHFSKQAKSFKAKPAETTAPADPKTRGSAGVSKDSPSCASRSPGSRQNSSTSRPFATLHAADMKDEENLQFFISAEPSAPGFQSGDRRVDTPLQTDASAERGTHECGEQPGARSPAQLVQREQTIEDLVSHEVEVSTEREPLCGKVNSQREAGDVLHVFGSSPISERLPLQQSWPDDQNLASPGPGTSTQGKGNDDKTNMNARFSINRIAHASTGKPDINPLAHAATGAVHSTGGSMHTRVQQHQGSDSAKQKRIDRGSPRKQMISTTSNTSSTDCLREGQNEPRYDTCHWSDDDDPDSSISCSAGQRTPDDSSGCGGEDWFECDSEDSSPSSHRVKESTSADAFSAEDYELSAFQWTYLVMRFSEEPYPSYKHLLEIAYDCDVDVSFIIYWYSDRLERMRNVETKRYLQYMMTRARQTEIKL